ncbi:glycosyltransferase [Flavisolibacter sp. BT320]|nr:glycosyltransferase [Flavisolibacter longurius]
MDCSVVIPVFYNAGTLCSTFAKVQAVLDNHSAVNAYEVIFVDDGSGDESYKELQDLQKAHPGIVKLIKFTRNFGQLAAIKAGYRFAKGSCIVNISADLQDPPELIARMLDEHFLHQYEIVICSREDREEGWFRKKTSQLFYKAIRKLSFQNMPAGGFDFTLVSKKAADAFSCEYEANNFWQGQILWTGFPVKFIPYKRQERKVGESRWTFSKKIKYLIDGVMAYSYTPLRFMSILGIISFLVGVIYAFVIVLLYFLGDVPFKGWAPIMIIVLVLSGLQMLMLGVIGEYLWRTLDQVRKRPDFVIEAIVE